MRKTHGTRKENSFVKYYVYVSDRVGTKRLA